MEITETEDRPTYHEKQELDLCLLHSLNNLYQREDAFSRVYLDGLAEQLGTNESSLTRYFRPHYDPEKGNYDVNVLLAALHQRGKNVVWHDRRQPAAHIPDLDGPDLFGIIINVPMTECCGLRKISGHWVALRRFNNCWYDLDSSLEHGPEAIGGTTRVREYLDRVLTVGGDILLVFNRAQEV